MPVHDATLIRSTGRIVRKAAWAPLSVLVIHEITARLYGHEPYVDPVMHFGGGLAAALFLRHTWAEFSRVVGDSTQLGQEIAAFSLACVVVLLWEFGEFAADQAFGSNIQRSLGNTMRDLVLGMVGAGIYVVGSRARLFARAR